MLSDTPPTTKLVMAVAANTPVLPILPLKTLQGEQVLGPTVLLLFCTGSFSSRQAMTHFAILPSDNIFCCNAVEVLVDISETVKRSVGKWIGSGR